MKILNQLSLNKSAVQDLAPDLKQGEVYSAQIKSKISNNEALLQIRGKEVKAKFENEIPSKNSITVQITKKSKGSITVKAVEGGKPKSSTAETKAGLGIVNPNDPPELKQAIRTLLGKGTPVTKESIQALKDFFVKAPGTVESKLNTIKAIADKKLDVTSHHLRSVHEALQGKSLHKVLTDLAKELDPDFELGKTELKNGEPNVNRPPSRVEGETTVSEKVFRRAIEKVRAYLAKNNHINPEVLRTINSIAEQPLDDAGRERALEQIRTLLTQASKSVSTSSIQAEGSPISIQPSEVMAQALKTIQKEPDLEKALNQLKEESTNQKRFDKGTVEKIRQSINESSALFEKGRELAARQLITQTLTDLQQELAKNDVGETDSAIQPLAYNLDEQLQAFDIQSKDIIVTRVTQKLAEITHNFREVKRELSKNLDTINRLVDTFKSNAQPQAKQMLENTISKLDNTILKSDIMLFTDMKTEKQLMTASSQLATAKKLLSKGNYSEATKIVQEVKTLIEKINFKPSDQKVMHFVSKENLNLENQPLKQQFFSRLEEVTQVPVRQDTSPRQMYETIRTMGINHDSELAKDLIFQKGHSQQDGQQQQQQQQNLKAILMKLLQTEGDTSTKATQHAEQALNNITGQQLLSKTDSSGTFQSMFLNIPLLLGEKPENIQVYLNSQKEGDQVDWENCSIYFLMETKKLGEVGIMLSSADRNLSITIKNDKPGFQEKMEPIASITKEKLNEIGYNVHSIKFSKITTSSTEPEKTADQEEKKPIQPIFSELGMDYKI